MKPLTHFLIIWLTFFTFVNIIDLQNHETTHKIIFKYFGYDSVINYDWLTFSATTTPIPNNHTISLAELDKLRELQSLAEIHGYNTFQIVYAILILGLLIGTSIIINGENKKIKPTQQPKN